MKISKYSLLAIGLAAMVAGCSDDDDYKVGEQSPGAYFPSTSPEIVELTEGASTVNVPICRTDATGTASYTISYYDESGLFTAPTTVTFDGTATEANIVFSYNPDEIISDVAYPCEITIAEGSTTIYGPSTYSFDFKLVAPMIEEEMGTGTYTYCNFFSGDDSGLTCYKVYSAAEDPDNLEEYQVKITHWGYDVDLYITVLNSYTYTSGSIAGQIPVLVSKQYIGYEHSTYGSIYVVDYASALADVNGGEPLNYIGSYPSSYDPETGVFNLYAIYVDADWGTWGLNGTETFKLDGFPDYSVSITYDGIYNTSDLSATSVIASVSSGSDVDQVLVANVEGSFDSKVVDAIVDGSVSSYTVSGGVTTEVKMPIERPGSYTMYAVSIADGEMADYSYYEYTATSFVVDQGTWESIGYATFVDGWIIPEFGYRDSAGTWVVTNPFDYEYTIEIQKEASGSYEGMYRMVYPYAVGAGNVISNSYNEELNTTYNIQFDMSDPEMIEFPFQKSGFMYAGINWYIADGTWKGRNSGDRDSAIKKNKKNSYYDADENAIYVQAPYTTTDGESVSDLASSNTAGYPAIIYMPGSYNPVNAAKVRAQAVTQHQLDVVFHPTGSKVDDEKPSIENLQPMPFDSDDFSGFVKRGLR
ncbi:MAG: hypothetical protein LIP03_12000 [Bacteroidales bacterium]|nr:hypothetical protein [Bacteroidales bacterium]